MRIDSKYNIGDRVFTISTRQIPLYSTCQWCEGSRKTKELAPDGRFKEKWCGECSGDGKKHNGFKNCGTIASRFFSHH